MFCIYEKHSCNPQTDKCLKLLQANRLDIVLDLECFLYMYRSYKMHAKANLLTVATIV